MLYLNQKRKTKTCRVDTGIKTEYDKVEYLWQES